MIVPLNPLEFRERAARLFGRKVGIVDGDKRFTYAEYDLRINRLANRATRWRRLERRSHLHARLMDMAILQKNLLPLRQKRVKSRTGKLSTPRFFRSN